jgi:hypothetical protein
MPPAVGILVRLLDGNQLVLDAVESEAFAPAVATTDHPIEVGSPVTDHARREPEVFTVVGLVTESPFAPAPGLVVGGRQRVLDALNFLEGSVGKFLDYVSVKRGTIRNCLVTGWAHTFTARGSLQLTIGLKQVRIAVVERIYFTPPATTAPLGPSPEVLAMQARARVIAFDAQRRLGLQATQDLTAGAEDSSAVYRLARSAGVREFP